MMHSSVRTFWAGLALSWEKNILKTLEDCTLLVLDTLKGKEQKDFKWC